ncbi:MAG: ABC transporter permease [Bacillota bacterium]
MTRYLVRRIGIMLPVLVGITFVNFLIINLAPGDAVDLMINPTMSEADRMARRQALGLNDPFVVRYARWLRELVTGNLGFSFTTYEPVAHRIAERLGPSLLLMGSAFLVGYAVAIPLGVLSALRPYSWVDYATGFLSVAGVSLPTFFVSLATIYVFALKLGWLPTGGMYTLGTEPTWSDLARHLVLPAAVLALANVGLVLRLTRSSAMEALRQDYTRTARAKGLPERRIIFRHVLRNSLIPVITMAGLQFPALIGGAVITEQVFQWPGMGSLTIQAILSRDYPTLMAINLLAAIAVLAGGLLSDVLYAVVDPRIRYQ